MHQDSWSNNSKPAVPTEPWYVGPKFPTFLTPPLCTYQNYACTSLVHISICFAWYYILQSMRVCTHLSILYCSVAVCLSVCLSVFVRCTCQVPYFLISHQDMPLDGSTPTLLYGYGGFEVSLPPTYSGVIGACWLNSSVSGSGSSSGSGLGPGAGGSQGSLAGSTRGPSRSNSPAPFPHIPSTATATGAATVAGAGAVAAASPASAASSASSFYLSSASQTPLQSANNSAYNLHTTTPHTPHTPHSQQQQRHTPGGNNPARQYTCYVLANIRGGGEFGPAWHQAALRENRCVSFSFSICLLFCSVDTLELEILFLFN
jgi:hypothetical protein